MFVEIVLYNSSKIKNGKTPQNLYLTDSPSHTYEREKWRNLRIIPVALRNELLDSRVRRDVKHPLCYTACHKERGKIFQ